MVFSFGLGAISPDRSHTDLPRFAPPVSFRQPIALVPTLRAMPTVARTALIWLLLLIAWPLFTLSMWLILTARVHTESP
jgi:hypothetical protein